MLHLNISLRRKGGGTMRKVLLSLVLALTLSISGSVFAQKAYNFGDYRSVTLSTKAWDALNKGDIEGVLAYASKCLELYEGEAKKMQASLDDYPKGSAEGGSNQEVFNYWALNDVGTCLFIQGEAFRKADMINEAKEVFNTLINEYSFSQCWDTKGWFWKPAKAAKEKLEMIKTGKSYEYGDYRSETLTGKAWGSLNKKDYEAAIAYADKCIELYKDKAAEMQGSLKEYPWETNEKVFSYWALNDVGTCLFIKGSALENLGKKSEAEQVFQELIDKYSFSQCWDLQGFFWKPVDAAREKLGIAPVVETISANGKFIPFAIYIDKGSIKNHFIPSGWMGDVGDINYNDASSEDPHSGGTCIKIIYSGKATNGARWAGMYWQNPANNWGNKKGGFDLIGAKKVSFWARGKNGGERIEEIKLGGITGDYPDSDSAGIGPVILTKNWKQYTIDLRGKDLSYISGGFCWATNADVNPDGATFYLDDVMYE